jgi:NodT family efflux transporter outer membrane factor (OMF) lipoprotein
VSFPAGRKKAAKIKNVPRTIRFRLMLLIAVCLAWTGCAVGPDFKKPDAPVPERYTPAPLPAQTVAAAARAGEAQRFAFAPQLQGDWWRLFGSPRLDSLIQQGIEQNPTLAAARAALVRAEEDLRAARGSLLFPAVNANLQGSRQRTSANIGAGDSNTYNLFNASVAVSYTLDIFGGGRRQMESYQAQVDYSRFQMEAAYLTLTSNIATTAITQASLAEQIAATREMIAAEEKQLELFNKQLELGAVSKAAVLTQEAQLAITRAGLPPLEKQLEATRHALAVLAGEFPAVAQKAPFCLDSLRLPEDLPVSLPSSLARQRPDIQAAEAQLHQACAAVGVATANLYPQITLSAGYGYASLNTDILFTGQSLVWNLGAGLLQPVFRGGELLARRRSALAAYDQAAAQYRQTVLKAFQDVADVLRALETDARSLQAAVEAEAAAQAALEMAEKQFELGAVNFATLLTAKRDYQKTRFNVIAARTQRFSDTAALFTALGGGWWTREKISSPPTERHEAAR